MPRFVLLEHDWPHPHFDLMLEKEGALATWRIIKMPGEQWQEAEELAAHRLEYLEYEGPVSGNRGCVKRVEGGSFEVVRWEAGRVEVVLKGDGVRGGLVMERRDERKWAIKLAN